MKLYHYITKGNSALTDGILSFARNPQADLTYYYRRSGADTHEAAVSGVLPSRYNGRGTV